MEEDDQDDIRGHLQQRFWIAIGLNSAILIAEFIGGILTNSLALLSDATYAFADVFALILSWIAIYLSTLPATNERTYGYHRAEVVVALINGVSLLAIVGLIFFGAIHRLMNPEPVKSIQMLIFAAAGLSVNLSVAIGFIKESHHSLNVRSAFFYVLGDALTSAGVILGGVIMNFTGLYIIDPVLSFAIGLAIVVGSGKVTYEAFHILLEGTPRHINIDDVVAEMKKLDFVKDVYDLHVWSISSDYAALSARVHIDAQSVRAIQDALDSIDDMLREKFRIIHTTIEPEWDEPDSLEGLPGDFRGEADDEERDEEMEEPRSKEKGVQETL